MIGALDEQVTLQRQSREADGAGGERTTWRDLEDDPRPWARVALRGGREIERNGRRIAVQTAEFTIRARSDVLAADRILWGGMIWDIDGPSRPVARARYVTISATAGKE